ncbi:MAG: rhodanese-like domain-containing protein [Methyloceanibacter sp.]|jgi:rhodanese-related sulfurtransferase
MFLALGSPAANADAATIRSEIDTTKIKPAKATPLGLYLTPQEAHRALSQNPDILFIDVRDPIEVMFVGLAEGVDKIVPIALATHEVDPETGQYRMVVNDDFITNVDEVVAAKGRTKTDPIFVSCRSGSRSAVAARKLIDAGYANVWNLVEGFEGDKAPDGTRANNGWRNAGLPWTYKLPPGVAWDN